MQKLRIIVNRYGQAFFTLVIAIILNGCATTAKTHIQASDHIELPYKAFGSSSESIIWPQHWQWSDAENHQPVSYDIRVIIYQGDNLDQLKSIYSIVPEKKQDYRFIQRDKAVEYLKGTISELEDTLFQSNDESECDFDMVYFHEISTLYKTLVKIEENF